MEDPKDRLELIEKYLAGQLVEDEKRSFEERMVKEEDLKKEVEEMEVLIGGMRKGVLEEKMGVLKEFENRTSFSEATEDAGLRDLKNREEIIVTEDLAIEENKNILRKRVGDQSGQRKMENGKRKAINTRRLWWLSAAAVFLIAAILIWPENPPPGPSEAYKHLFESGEFEKLIKHEVMRGPVKAEDLSPEQLQAYNLFSAKMFEEAIPKLKSLWEEQGDSLALYYLGYSYLGIGEDEKGEGIIY